MVTWAQLQSIYTEDPSLHFEYCQSMGLNCPLEVFTQLFHEQLASPILPALTATVDWTAIRWSLEILTGQQLCWVHIDRQFERAVDDAYLLTLEEGLTDERDRVREAWEQLHTWLVPPVLVTGEVLGKDYPNVLLVGNTRLGNLLGLQGRGEVAPERSHRVWIGRPIEVAP